MIRHGACSGLNHKGSAFWAYVPNIRAVKECKACKLVLKIQTSLHYIKLTPNLHVCPIWEKQAEPLTTNYLSAKTKETCLRLPHTSTKLVSNTALTLDLQLRLCKSLFSYCAESCNYWNAGILLKKLFVIKTGRTPARCLRP